MRIRTRCRPESDSMARKQPDSSRYHSREKLRLRQSNFYLSGAEREGRLTKDGEPCLIFVSPRSKNPAVELFVDDEDAPARAFSIAPLTVSS